MAMNRKTQSWIERIFIFNVVLFLGVRIITVPSEIIAVFIVDFLVLFLYEQLRKRSLKKAEKKNVS